VGIAACKNATVKPVIVIVVRSEFIQSKPCTLANPSRGVSPRTFTLARHFMHATSSTRLTAGTVMESSCSPKILNTAPR